MQTEHTEQTRLTISPAYSNEDHNLLYRAITENSEPVDSHCCLRGTAMVSSLGVSVISGVAFIPVSLELPAGRVFAAANFVGFLKLYMWAIRNTIHELWGPKIEVEKILIERAYPGKCVTIAAATAAIALALLSQLPSALPVLDYDGKLKVPAFMSLLVGGSLLSLRSLQLSLERMTQEQDNKRKMLVSMVDNHLDVVEGMGSFSRIEHVERLNANPEELIKEVFKEASTRKVSPAAYLFGFWIALSFQIATAIYTFEKTKEHMIDNHAAAGAMALSAVASSAYFSFNSIMESAQAFYEMLVERRIATAEQLHPALTRSLKILGAVVDIGALGACYRIWDQFYKDNMSAKVYFEITVCLAFFLFLSASTHALSYELAGKKGDEETQLIMAFTRKLENIKRLILLASERDLKDFIKMLPEETRRKFQLSFSENALGGDS